MLLLDGERAARTNLDRMGSPKANNEGERIGGTDGRRERANKKNFAHYFPEGERAVLARKTKM